MAEENLLLKLEDLKTYFHTEEGTVRAVDGVSYEIRKGETLGVVGESGCGKSVTALSVLRLVQCPPGDHAGGHIWFRGMDLLALSEAEMRRIRGKEISMIFQEPMTSLNPVFRVGDQIMEAITLHDGVSKAEARERAIDMLRKVQIPSPEVRIDDYPHQMSGGMRQRVMIAMALSCQPHLLIADEPSTALDVTVQAQILDLLIGLQRELGMSVLLITHDLAVVAEVANHVAVMYAGKVAEYGTVEIVFERPAHPYTEGLFNSLPRLGGGAKKLVCIEGTVPDPLHFPSGCKFRTRCPYAYARCEKEEPPLREVGPGHTAACWLHEDKPDAPPAARQKG